MKIAVVSPHRMDAALSLGLAVEAWLEQGHAVEVVNCFTRSERAPFSDANSVHANDRMSFVSALRKREDEEWRKQYRSPKLTVTDLNLKDAPLRLHCSPVEVCSVAVNATDKAFAKIAKALEQSRAEAFVLPLALGGDMDHRTACEAAAVWAVGAALAFYEELPPAADMATPIQDAARTVAERFGMALEPVFASDTCDANVALARKRRLALCYVSQLEDAQVEQAAAFCVQYAGRERMWATAEFASKLACRGGQK